MPLPPEPIPLPATYAAALAHAQRYARENRRFLTRLRKKPPRTLDDTIHDLHTETFGRIDCLQCANCCKTTSPIFYARDVERAARHLRLKPSQFIDAYLRVDEDGDYVLQCVPCPFLSADNYCGIYEYRPTACREYPHTDRKKMHQLLELTYQNTRVCPAVATIVAALHKCISV